MGAEFFRFPALGVETLENRGFLAGGNAGALIVKMDHDPAVFPGRGQGDRAVAGTERLRIVQNVPENLGQAAFDAVDHQRPLIGGYICHLDPGPRLMGGLVQIRQHRQHGARIVRNFSVELDALPPEELRFLVRSVIEEHLPEGHMENIRFAEAEERQGFSQLLTIKLSRYFPDQTDFPEHETLWDAPPSYTR